MPWMLNEITVFEYRLRYPPSPSLHTVKDNETTQGFLGLQDHPILHVGYNRILIIRLQEAVNAYIILLLSTEGEQRRPLSFDRELGFYKMTSCFTSPAYDL